MCITFKLQSLIATELSEKETLNITDTIPTGRRESIYQNLKNYCSLTGLRLILLYSLYGLSKIIKFMCINKRGLEQLDLRNTNSLVILKVQSCKLKKHR